MKRRSSFISELPVIQECWQLVTKELEDLNVYARLHVSAELSDSVVIPKKWQGFEIPMDLTRVRVSSFEAQKDDFKRIFQECYTELADRLFTCGSDDIQVQVLLISRCFKSKLPGVIFLWKR